MPHPRDCTDPQHLRLYPHEQLLCCKVQRNPTPARPHKPVPTSTAHPSGQEHPAASTRLKGKRKNALWAKVLLQTSCLSGQVLMPDTRPLWSHCFIQGHSDQGLSSTSPPPHFIHLPLWLPWVEADLQKCIHAWFEAVKR